jgi:predicted GTPase
VLPDLVKMGIPEIFYISAEQGDGVLELLQRIDQEIPN